MGINVSSLEIHISGRIDNFLFGKIKKSYFDELEKSAEVFKDNKKDNQLFLQKFFSKSCFMPWKRRRFYRILFK